MTSQQARELAKSTLSDGRIRHTECVAAAAGHLVLKYGGDPERIQLAAFLHDILKENSNADLLQRLRGSDIIDFTQIEHSPAVWHAFAGGLYVRDELGLDADIAAAVMYHTTGRKGMSLLEKIIFLADYISMDREYHGVLEVRKLAENSLEEACIAALRNNIIHICKKQESIDLNSVFAFNDLIDNRRN